ncbi:MAG: DoxX family protein [Gammaproteobacteria bacterium]|nr:DoxX family protein [Gammaproteobacteria bacterium]
MNANVLNLVGRIGLALIFVMAGFNKIGGYEGTVGYMESMGVPGALLPLVIALELGGGLAIIAGFFIKPIALALAGFSVAAAVLFHGNLGDQMQMILFMKNIGLAGGFLLLAANGPGDYSVDAKRQ